MSNVDTAKIFFGIVLDKLQVAFPAAYHVVTDDLWPDFERLAMEGQISIKDGKRRFRHVAIADASQNEAIKSQYVRLMLHWMATEGYIHPDPASNFKFDYVLSGKALAVLGLSLEADDETLGSRLRFAIGTIGEQTSGELVSQIISRGLEVMQGIQT
ncbi:hypothetical protein [Rhodophyticola sp.]|jgi:hypothetical protein|uniref:hypothetical protein n=1 Tax=Rhodophyticola sp. TaxID=2680032 RepID=UPI003D270D89